MSQCVESKSERRSWKASLGKDVADDIVIECQLFVLAFAAGILDATTFPDYSVFVSNQTGNTALLAVGALGISNVVKLKNVAFSLSLFIIGGFLFGQIGDRLGRRRKAWLVTTNILQTALMGGATVLRKWYQKDHDKASPYAWPVIAFLAFASGGQVAMARTVNLPQIPTAMVTSAYIDFFTDPDITKMHNRPRNRRLVFVLCLIAGSFVGAGAYAAIGPAFPLFIATLCKVLVCVSFFFNPPVPEGEIDEDVEPTVQEAAPPEQETNPA